MQILSVVYILLLCATVIVAIVDDKLQVVKNEPSIVVYWGQNSAGSTYQKPGYEKPLNVVCSESYEFIILSFLNIFFDSNNKDNLPGINLSFHCKTQYNSSYSSLLHCPELASHVNKCQSMGKKILMSLGGAVGSYYFSSDRQANMFARTIWDLLLGGQKPNIPRPFDDVILDGIDLDIEGGSSTGYASFVKTLHSLMMADNKKQYYISGAPQCPYPDAYLGPKQDTALGDAGSYFSFLSIQFYNNYCNYPSESFIKTWYKWSNWTNILKPAGPKLYIGLLAQKGSNGYVPPGDLKDLFNLVSREPTFAGAMLWDASWAEDNVSEGKKYYECVYNVLKNL